MFKIRFHLAAGKNFMHWQVKNTIDNTISYYDPQKINLKLSNTKLRNSKGVAKKIFEGGEKVVCAWVQCSHIEVITNNTIDQRIQLQYNPRIKPHWIDKNSNNIVDNKEYDLLFTAGNKIYY